MSDVFIKCPTNTINTNHKSLKCDKNTESVDMQWETKLFFW